WLRGAGCLGQNDRDKAKEDTVMMFFQSFCQRILMMNRRSFLAAAASAGATLAAGAEPPNTKPSATVPKKRLQLGVCTYSYWHFRDPKISVETVIDKAGELGVAGVDILHRQMDIPEKEPLTAEHRVYLQKLKRQAFRNGVSLVCLSTHQTFLTPDAAKLTENVRHTAQCIEICYERSAPSMRIKTGRWGTIDDFDELMKHR